MLDSESPLYLDITEDLQRVDGVMTKLVSDRALWQEFLRDPNRIMIRLGLHPDTSPEINTRMNSIFWATLTDRELLSILTRHYASFDPARSRDMQRYFLTGLGESSIRHDPDYDLQALNHLIEDGEVLNKVLIRAFTTINNAGLTEQRYSDEDIRNYAAVVSNAIQEGLPLREFPKLERWDNFHGIGEPFGFAFVEVSVIATIGAVTEVDALVTVHMDIQGYGAAIEQSMREALEGDAEAIRRVAIAGRALDFGAELLVHAHNFHRRMYHRP